MTRKLEDLEILVYKLKEMGYRKQIPRKHIDYFIAREFGTSKYIIDSVVDSLVKFGFLEITNAPGIFKVCEGWTPILMEKGDSDGKPNKAK